MKNDPFWIRLASDERLLDLAEAFAPFINGSIALFSSHYFCKMPGTGKAVLWHQDGRSAAERQPSVTFVTTARHD